MDERMKREKEAVIDRLSATLRFDGNVASVKLVSQRRASALRERGVTSVRHLLNLFPRRYIDMSRVATIAESAIGDSCTIAGEIYALQKKTPRPRLDIVEITIVDDTGSLLITCFNQPWLMKNLSVGETLSVSGTVEFNYGFKRMTNPVMEPIDPRDTVRGLVLPIHPANASISRALMRRIVSNALASVRGLYDPLPLSLRVKYRLCSRYQAYRQIHEPYTSDDIIAARRRLIYEELLFLELSLLIAEKARMDRYDPFIHTIDQGDLVRFEELLPFALTDEQRVAIHDLVGGMCSSHSTNHLLLGDVGTGKTVVALFGLLVACHSGNQAVMMGPTEVLVRQYEVSLGGFLDELGISWAILTASTSPEERKRIFRETRDGSLQVLFGTHALLNDELAFASCSFVCIDEQQRFGVAQRQELIAKASGADILSLTATPIPRSLALALYGNLTLSYLHTRPHAITERHTKVCHFSEQGLAYDAIREAIGRGEQAYIICPLIGIETDELDTDDDDRESGGVEYAAIEWGLETDTLQDEYQAALTHARILQEQVFPQARIGLLHGRMSNGEKKEVMEDFRAGKVDVLVSTTVVEVGVDVPNATVMVIEDADRFGLAQLHQLRGRVGRGEKSASVFLVSRSKSPAALERLKAMETIDDGFKLSEFDLRQRREGDIFGDRQHGVSPLRLVNVVRDKAVIEAARADAYAIIFDHVLDEDEYRILDRERKLAMGDEDA